jgi:hypothetical protein
MQKTQRTFTREFKVEAVQLVQSSQKPLAQIARDLGIADSTCIIGVSCSPSKASKPFREVGIKPHRKKKSDS